MAGGLVLIVILTAFTIMQHAFAGGALAQGLISDAERKALALVGAGHSVWDWDVARDRISVGPEVEDSLGLMDAKAVDFALFLYQGDGHKNLWFSGEDRDTGKELGIFYLND